MIDLDELERLEREATQGEWLYDDSPDGGDIEAASGGAIAYIADHASMHTIHATKEYRKNADGRLIVALRNQAGQLLRAARELGEVKERVERQDAELKARRPCQHPARVKHGRHEWYIDVMTGSGNCRACGAVHALLLPASPEGT